MTIPVRYFDPQIGDRILGAADLQALGAGANIALDLVGAQTLGATALFQTVRIDSSGGACNVSLPPAPNANDWTIIRKRDNSTNRVTVKNAGTDVAWLSAQHDEVLFACWAGVWIPVQWSIAPITDLFTASATWTKAPLAKFVAAVAIGAGAGGASGRRGAAASIRGGGGAGMGGVLNRWMLNAPDLGATEAVTIGAGGTPGAAQTVDSTDGVVGSAGGNSSFGTHLVTPGGTGGVAGTTAAGVAAVSLQALSGATSLGASAVSVSAVSAVPTASAGAGTAGNGGSITAGNADFAGATGANGSTASTPTTGGTGGANAGANAGAAGGSIADSVNQFGGAGGGGGGGNASGAGGTGGSGGTPGGGGGGGGASLNGNASGAGGAGSRGEARVTTYF